MDPTDKFAQLASLFQLHAELTATIRDEQMSQRSLRIEQDNARQERRQALETCLRNGDRAAYGRLKSAGRIPEPSEPRNDFIQQLQELSRIQTEIDELLSSEGFQE